MDPKPSSTSVASKPSGLPRPSKLPVLTSNSLQTSQIGPKGTLEGQKRQVIPAPTIEKRSSVAALPRAGQPAAKPSVAKSNAVNGIKHGSQASKSISKAQTSALRPSSSGNQQRGPAVTAKATKTAEDEENHDQISTLDSFRSTSRQDSQDGRALWPEDQFEPAESALLDQDRKRSRPSLSDRTIESIQNLPSTPKDRRRSSFFSPIESPMGPPPRPMSSLSRNGSNNSSRPGTSDGFFGRPSGRPPSRTQKTSASAKATSRTSLGGFGLTPDNSGPRSVSSAFSNRLRDGSESKQDSQRSPSPSKQSTPNQTPNGRREAKPIPASKTMAAKPKKPRPELSDAFGPAVRDSEKQDGLVLQTSPPASAHNSTSRTVSNPSKGSSAALRQQIAAAKAAARKEKAKPDSPQPAASAGVADFAVEMHADPFNHAPKDGKHILRNRINTARMDGKLNIAAMGLKEIPHEVMHMYDAKAIEESKVNWAEVVDLSRLNAADNEIEELRDDIFPDKSAEDYAEDDLTEGNQFGGLQAIDFHGNRISTIPIGLRRLEMLTSLNLSHNKVENSAVDVISQIPNLKELRLSHNTLSGTAPSSISALRALQTLDLSANRLLGLPESLRELTSLTSINVSGNQLTALPMEALKDLPLTSIDASSNALIGPLIPVGCRSGHPTLRSLLLSNNSLAALTFSDTLDMPQLVEIDVSNNHIASLPPVTGYPNVINLTVKDNKLKVLPSGFSTLSKLKKANFASNDIRLLDSTIANMESLDTLILSSNPLRDKKFLNMNTADIKRDLKARLEPNGPEDAASWDEETYHDARDSASPPPSSPSSTWSLKQNGTLDLAGKGYFDAINDSLGSFLKSNEVKQLLMTGNKLTSVPPALWLGHDLKVLDLSGSAFVADYFSDDLELPSLQELNLCRCSIKSLEPLMTHLHAPALRRLDLVANKLTGALPSLRSCLPALTTLLADDNKFITITAESLRGMHAVNLSNNSLEQIPAEIGLLWDEGLKSLEIRGNAFRVPNIRILEKGTEATMRWLRDKLPAQPASATLNGDRGLEEVD